MWDLQALNINDHVWITDLKKYGEISKVLNDPRSYVIRLGRKSYRGNKWHFIPAPHRKNNNDETDIEHPVTLPDTHAPTILSNYQIFSTSQ